MRKVIFTKKLKVLIFFVTSKCNSRCIGCFNWKNINRKDDLTISEIKKISSNMPKFNHVLFSGGEPFLRKDLPEICRIFRNQNNIRAIGIPTNGLLTNKIRDQTEKILKENPDMQVNIHFSLDGLEKTHDKLRGVKGNFKKVLKSIENINSLKNKYFNLKFTVNTVISNRNYKEIKKLVDLVKKFNAYDHTFDYLRGSFKNNNGIGLPPFRNIIKINKIILDTKKYYIKNRSLLWRFLSFNKLNYLLNAQINVLKNSKLPFVCLAGKIVAVIDNNGKVRLCEHLDPIGNLRKENYDFKKIWKNRKSKTQRRIIKEHKCDCTHVCFLSMSIDNSPFTILKTTINYVLKK